MTQDWTATIASERMELDAEFADRIQASSFSSQQWSLVMTAVSFRIENPGTPSEASLVADTGNLPAVLPELDRVDQARPGADPSGDAGGGFLSKVLGAFGSGGGGDDERLEEAETLADEYASRLQEKLREGGRWASVCERAASG